jgi:hypothetical protein
MGCYKALDPESLRRTQGQCDGIEIVDFTTRIGVNDNTELFALRRQGWNASILYYFFLLFAF